MTTSVSFENVSKRYRLGLTRTSLPTLVSNTIKMPWRQRPTNNEDKKVLWALKDVSFELKAGDSLALVGANGAGKTTILKLLANISKPTSGTINVNGQLSALIELGAGFHPDLTGRENVFLNGTILGLSRSEIERKFDQIVAFSEIERFIDTPVKRYSSGMIVRLGFAIASSIEPEILLVDEVLAVGDASFQQKCLGRIRDLIDQGTSIIFVSHNFYLVQTVCKNALYLEHGRIKRYGSTNEVIDIYENDLHLKRAQELESSTKFQEADQSDLKITGVEILGPGGVQGESLPNTQPVQIQIHYESHRPMGKVNVSVFIKRSDGLICCMMRTKLDNYELLLDRGQGIITLTLDPIQLITGTYFAEAWFLNESDSMGIIPSAGRSEWFLVKGSALSYSDDSGIFEPKTHWNHQRVVDTVVRENTAYQSS